MSKFSKRLNLAVELNVKSLAVPALGNGLFEFPLESAAEVVVTTIVEFVKQKRTSLKSIMFVIKEEQEVWFLLTFFKLNTLLLQHKVYQRFLDLKLRQGSLRNSWFYYILSNRKLVVKSVSDDRGLLLDEPREDLTNSIKSNNVVESEVKGTSKEVQAAGSTDNTISNEVSRQSDDKVESSSNKETIKLNEEEQGKQSKIEQEQVPAQNDALKINLNSLEEKQNE